MKVILQKDVAKIGKRYAVVEVPDGYALNKLIPQKMALPATAENLKRIQNIKAEASAHFEADEKAYQLAVAELATKRIELKVQANAQGHLFKAVKSKEIYEALIASGVIAIPLEAIVIDSPIKSCGEYAVALHFHSHHDSVTIFVVAK